MKHSLASGLVHFKNRVPTPLRTALSQWPKLHVPPLPLPCLGDFPCLSFLTSDRIYCCGRYEST